VRPFEVEAEPAIDDEADGNIGNGEGIAAHIRPAAVEMVVELAHFLGDLPPSLLDEPRGTALLTMERTTYDASGRAIEFGQHVYRASRYALVSAVTIGEATVDQRV